MTHSPLHIASGRSLPDSDHIRPILVWWMGPMLVWWYLAHWCAVTWAPIRCVIFGPFSALLGECGQFLLDKWGPLLLDDIGTILVRWCAHGGDQTSKYLDVVMYRISWYIWCIFWVTRTAFTHVKLVWKFGDFRKTRLMCNFGIRIYFKSDSLGAWIRSCCVTLGAFSDEQLAQLFQLFERKTLIWGGDD